MKKLNYQLLKEVQAQYKKQAYVPPPEYGQPQQEPYPPDQMGMQQSEITSQEQLIQMVQQGLSQGVSPEEVMSTLIQQGVPAEVVSQVVQDVMGQLQQTQPESASQSQQPAQPPQSTQASIAPISIEEEAKKKVDIQLKKDKLSPEERFLMIEKKVEILTELMENIINSQQQQQQ